MRGKAPRVGDWMTHLPVEAERCETLAEAAKLMETYRIRHLPVMSALRLKGILSERDVLELRVSLGDAADKKPVEDVCQTDVLTVSPVTPVDQVAEQMLARHVGSAVVVDGGYVVGMFTTTDALRVVRDLFAKS